MSTRGPTRVTLQCAPAAPTQPKLVPMLSPLCHPHVPIVPSQYPHRAIPIALSPCPHCTKSIVPSPLCHPNIPIVPSPLRRPHRTIPMAPLRRPHCAIPIVPSPLCHPHVPIVPFHCAVPLRCPHRALPMPPLCCPICGWHCHLCHLGRPCDTGCSARWEESSSPKQSKAKQT